MFRAAWWNASLGYETTGANLAWMIQAQVARGALAFAENITALEQGFTRLWQEAKVVNRSLDFNLAQGIQVRRRPRVAAALCDAASVAEHLHPLVVWHVLAARLVVLVPRSSAAARLVWSRLHGGNAPHDRRHGWDAVRAAACSS